MTGKTYAVTGCFSGIGAETARILKHQGHRVVGLDVRQTSSNVDTFIQFDLMDPVSIDAAAAALPRELNGIANIAGLPPRPDWQARVLQVNYHGQRRFLKAALARLAKGGSIVNLASRAGRDWAQNVDQVKRLTQAGDLDAFVAAEGLAPARAYNLSKEAMILWAYAESEGLAKRGFRINSVSPSAVATGILDVFLTAFGPGVGDRVARVGRPGEPAEIAEVVAFLLSDNSRWIRGTDIWSDGGMAAFTIADTHDLAALRCLDG